MTNAFPSSERGDTTVARFEQPRVGLIKGNDGGKQFFGMPDKPQRRHLSHQFEATKAQQNGESLQRQGEVPQAVCPQRWQAGSEWHAARQEERSRQWEAQDAAQALHDKEALEGITHQQPTYMTSADNPLCLGCARAAPASSDSHSDTDSDGSAESADDESGGEGSCPSQQQTKQQAPEFRSHMEYGSMEPLQDAEQEQEPSKVEQEVAKCMEQLHKLEEAYEQLMLMYPHGVPKRKLLELRNQGLTLPSLGFGFEINLPTRLAGFMHRC